MAPFEVWASPEPSFARIGQTSARDLLAETGHERRDADIGLLASLGIRATRYPVLWEKCAPEPSAAPDFAWARRRLEALREARIEPILTLVHHGSGPRWTSLTDPGFPQALAHYAAAAASAFPWVKRWTPLNEPLATARFATLYGVWYPNRVQDHAAFGHAVAYQALGTLLAMEAIRTRIPDAELVATEDLQGFDALDDDTEVVRYVAHKRERAFLSIELLMGRVRPGHALYAYLGERCGVARGLLARIVERAIVPDLIGWNYYPYSERVLSRTPSGAIANEGRVIYAPGTLAPETLLRRAHERLGIPFGLSEVHVHAPEAGRVRWLLQRHAELTRLAAGGFPVRMFGAWAAFGTLDWDSLLTRREHRTEDGIFTFAGGDETPRETAVAPAVRALACGESVAFPQELGWWETHGEAT